MPKNDETENIWIMLRSLTVVEKNSQTQSVFSSAKFRLIREFDSIDSKMIVFMVASLLQRNGFTELEKWQTRCTLLHLEQSKNLVKRIRCQFSSRFWEIDIILKVSFTFSEVDLKKQRGLFTVETDQENCPSSLECATQVTWPELPELECVIDCAIFLSFKGNAALKNFTSIFFQLFAENEFPTTYQEVEVCSKIAAACQILLLLCGMIRSI